ncbi:MAG: hypothetical protein KJO69_08790, partial [Gammaproteobacteria bacterium]|nr:hypothetical protein [Gammaproteobacteria bacterium]
TAQAEPVSLKDKMDAFMDADDLDDVNLNEPSHTASEEPPRQEEPIQEPSSSEPEPEPTPSTQEEDDFTTPLDDFKPKSTNTDDGFDPNKFEEETWNKIKEMGTDPHAGIKYKELRDELKAYKQKESEFSQSVESSEEVMQLKAKLESLEEIETQYQEMRNKAAMVDYTQTEEYKQYVDAPFSRMITDATALEEHLGFEENAIMKAIATSDRKTQDRAIEDLTRDVPPRYAREIEQMASDLLKLYRTEATIKDEAATRLDRYQESETARQAAERERSHAVFKNQVGKTFERYQTKIPSLLDDQGNPISDYNDMLGKAEAIDFDDLDVESRGFAAMAAVTMPHLVSSYKQMQVKLKEANTLISAMKASNPSSVSPPDAGGTPRKHQPKVQDKMKSFLDMDFE